MENHDNKEQISTATEKKIWAMPELIIIDKNVIEGGRGGSYEAYFTAS